VRLAVGLLAGVVGLTVAACGRSESSHPSAPAPNPLVVSFSPTQVSQGEQSTFTITLPTTATVGSPIVLELGGIARGADTTVIPQNNGGLEGTLDIPGPAIDGTVTLTIILPLLQDSATASLVVKDAKAPTFSLAYINSVAPMLPANFVPGAAMLVAGTTDTMTASVADNHALAWVGWTMGSAGDSVQVTDSTTASVLLPVALPNSFAGTAPTFTMFATDLDGNRGEYVYGPTAVAAYVQHPVATIARGGKISDVAFDLPRHLLYLAQPDSQRIDVLSLATWQYQAPIPLDSAPVAMDLSAGGDSLVVGLGGHPRVAIVDLRTPAYTTTVTVLSPIANLDTVPTILRLRVGADDHALISLRDPSGTLNTVVNLNVATGDQQVGVIPNAYYTNNFPLTRSIDRTHVLLPDLNANGGSSTLYTTAAASYATVNAVGGAASVNAFASADQQGQYYQIGHNLYDATMTYIGTMGFDGNDGAVLAPNGTDFYIGECNACDDNTPALLFHYAEPMVLSPPGGFLGAVHPAGQLLDLSPTPFIAHDLIVTPDGKTLIGIGATTLMAIDLTQSSPATPTIAIRPARRPSIRGPLRTTRNTASRFVLHLFGSRPVPTK